MHPNEPFPARIDVLLACEADVGVIFRRGPSRAVCLLKWNLKTDAIEEGQWLKGRIYPKRSDLSPSGRLLVYFAGNFRSDGPHAWTAISSPPRLTAKIFLPQDTTYYGGGLFVDERNLWLNNNASADLSSQGLNNSKPAPSWNGDYGNSECLGVYLPRLRRDGWEDFEVIEDPEDSLIHTIVLRRPLKHGIVLEKRVGIGSWEDRTPGRGGYFDQHALLRGDVRLDWPGGEWADVDRRGRLLAARDGKLVELIIDGDTVNESVIADLNPLQFRAVAPSEPGKWIARDR